MNNIKAFTLIELSIVLVIIGLIVGGVVGGSSLIQQNKLRVIVTEQTQYKTAINAFKVQFNALPGDFSNATAFWYDATNCPGTNNIAGSCNGNGDGYIWSGGGASFDESLMAWRHLASSGILSGNYTGRYATASQNDIGSNVPPSKFGNNIGWFFTPTGIGGNGWISGNFLSIGQFTAGAFNSGKFLSPQDAYSIDLKADDGFPISKLIRGGSFNGSYNGSNLYGNGGAAGTTCADSGTNTYNLTLNNPVCFMQFEF
jgi:prepilin-type N-terminal cleavage/methylation domain-containing protein